MKNIFPKILLVLLCFMSFVTPVEATTTTYYPDPFDGGIADGYTRRDNVEETWATIKAGAGTDANWTPAGSQRIIGFRCHTTNSRYDQFYRGIYQFDTSAIPDSATLDSATFSVAGTGKTNDASTAFDINVYSITTASTTSLANADHANAGTTKLSDTDISYASYNTSGYNDFTLNASGMSNITKTGVSKFTVRSPTYDVGSTGVSWATANAGSFLSGAFAETASTTSDPKLVVTYTTTARRVFLTK